MGYLLIELACHDNKVAVKALFYTQGLSSYGYLKGAKNKNSTKKIVLPFLRLVYGNQVFSDAAKIVPCLVGTNGE